MRNKQGVENTDAVQLLLPDGGVEAVACRDKFAVDLCRVERFVGMSEKRTMFPKKCAHHPVGVASGELGERGR